MAAWHSVEGKYHYKQAEVKLICEQHFGPEHKTKFNPASKRKMDNHGNWRIQFNGTVEFRYAKHASWFLLMCSNLADPPRPERRWTSLSGKTA